MDASNESARPTPACRAPLGGGGVAPAGRAGFVARTVSTLRASTWAPVAAKAVAIASGMVVLAGIGAASTFAGRGVPVASAAPVASAPPASVAAKAAAPPASGVAQTPPPAPSGAVPAAAASAQTSGAQQGPGLTPDGKVILNQATVDELVKLPRVGPKRAEAIVALRRRLGRFRQVTDLLRVKGIGRKTLKLMMPNLILDGTGS